MSLLPAPSSPLARAAHIRNPERRRTLAALVLALALLLLVLSGHAQYRPSPLDPPLHTAPAGRWRLLPVDLQSIPDIEPLLGHALWPPSRFDLRRRSAPSEGPLSLQTPASQRPLHLTPDSMPSPEPARDIAASAQDLAASFRAIADREDRPRRHMAKQGTKGKKT
ncbi:uncharacterized protein FIBRA_07258 [Fibroporia radiculosa]|uniref:Uncharacterized protein n=1 Tax=Fibroporia radiculosa TaxID=599839 RepID=J4GUL2_9APHY|nr:uncharacterized protein FIBRA_07258 [Fibroporia radiculosa]CCM05055.1 predicted protein [Fibroporia radiculosa]